MIKPFKLDHLKKVTKKEVALVRSLYEFLPQTDIREKIHLSIRKALMKHLGQDIRYFSSAIDKIKFTDFVAKLPASPVIVILGMLPAKKKVFLQIDPVIADIIIDKLLGGGENVRMETAPLTETEQGVLQYLIMQVLQQIYSLGGADSRVHFRMESFVFEPKGLAAYASSKDELCVIDMDVAISGKSGFVRLAFPYPFLEEMSAMRKSAGDSKGERAHFKNELSKWDFIKTSVWAEAGYSVLTPEEMKDLGDGDVILLDDSFVTIDGKNVKGKVKLHFSTSETEADADVAGMDRKKIQCRLRGIGKRYSAG